MLKPVGGCCKIIMLLLCNICLNFFQLYISLLSRVFSCMFCTRQILTMCYMIRKYCLVARLMNNDIYLKSTFFSIYFRWQVYRETLHAVIWRVSLEMCFQVLGANCCWRPWNGGRKVSPKTPWTHAWISRLLLLGVPQPTYPTSCD